MADIIIIIGLVCLCVVAGVIAVRQKGCSCSCKDCPHCKNKGK